MSDSAHNPNGDLTTAGDLTFDYTPFHRMYQAKQDNNILFTSGFDGNGQRVYKTINGKTTLYLRDFSG
ncbi:MAG TPA: hypothetical protein EYP35_05770, partial [Desulfobacterales bacterium]|nr:hypothetical protein [Desulfobacterales bacterium]